MRRCFSQVFAPWACVVTAACASPPTSTATPPIVSVPPIATTSAARPTPKPAPPPPPAADPVGDARTFLADGWGKTERRRARLAEGGTLAWSLDAAKANRWDVKADARALDTRVVVVERHPGHLRIVHDGPDVRLVAYLANDKFHEVLARRSTVLDERGLAFDDGCGATFESGSRLQAAPAVGDYRRINHRTKRVAVSGLLPRKALGIVYEHPKPAPKTEPDCNVQPPLTLLDAPSGRPVAKLLGKVPLDCRLAGPRGTGATKIEVRDGRATIVGYAPAAAVTPRSSGGSMSGYGSGMGSWGMSHATLLYLWPGDLLFQPDAGAPVGRVLKRSLKVALSKGRGGAEPTVRMPVHPWGWLSFGVTPKTIEAAKKKRAAWLARVQFNNVTVVGGASKAAALSTLASNQSGLAGCYDDALERTPGRRFRYAVELVLGTRTPRPKLTGTGPSDQGLESCMQIWLREPNSPHKGTRVRFDLELQPDPLLDATSTP